MKKLTIVLVTWNSQNDIIECLSSIFNNLPKTKKFELETIIVDNNSSDKTLALIDNYIKLYEYEIKLIKNEENLGFTRGCNQAIQSSTGDYVFILNPDTEMVGSALASLVDYLKHHDNVGAVAPQLTTFHADIRHSCRTFPRYTDMFLEMSLLSSIFPKSHIFSRWKMKYFRHNETREVDQPMGAALMLKRNVLEQIGGMDERYTMFFNDVDFCRRIYDEGYKIVFFHEAKVKHREGASVYKDRGTMILHWNNDCLKYFKKHNYNFILYPFLWMGLRLTGILRVIYYKFR
ncbi:MAG: glycosyltransferase family 2 protein [Ignavibacteriae bacterium]|nr:glycosyltransferase family 2 protein [Ignavibacteriota bacterium]